MCINLRISAKLERLKMPMWLKKNLKYNAFNFLSVWNWRQRKLWFNFYSICDIQIIIWKHFKVGRKFWQVEIVKERSKTLCMKTKKYAFIRVFVAHAY
jgi:hypothetical protein